jgi:hypothetical protein
MISVSRAVALCLTANLIVATSAAAQSTSASSSATSNVGRTVWLADNVTNGSLGQQRIASRDSLRNGAVIGAVIGGVALGAFAAALCKAYQEDGGASCLPDAFRFAAIGAAIGTGAGLAIDAARNDRGVTVRFAIRF